MESASSIDEVSKLIQRRVNSIQPFLRKPPNTSATGRCAAEADLNGNTGRARYGVRRDQSSNVVEVVPPCLRGVPPVARWRRARCEPVCERPPYAGDAALRRSAARRCRRHAVLCATFIAFGARSRSRSPAVRRCFSRPAAARGPHHREASPAGDRCSRRPATGVERQTTFRNTAAPQCFSGARRSPKRVRSAPAQFDGSRAAQPRPATLPPSERAGEAGGGSVPEVPGFFGGVGVEADFRDLQETPSSPP